MSCNGIVVFVLCGVSLLTHPVAAVELSDSFSSDPFSNWFFGIGDNSNNQFIWDPSTPSAYAGDPVGSLNVHLDSSLPTVRFQRSLGVTLTDTDNFMLRSRLSGSVSNAPGDQFMQVAFGLVNSNTTGGDRVGSSADFTSDNVFDTVEVNYFPNVSTVFGTGPALTPAVFGAQKGSLDAFGNFASAFGSGSDLGDNTVGITELPEFVPLEFILDYDGALKSLSLTVSQVNLDGSLTPLNTELPVLQLPFLSYDEDHPFVIDSLAIMAYHDGFTTVENPSLIVDLTFEVIEFTSPIPEPSSSALVCLGLLIVVLRSKLAPSKHEISKS